MPRPDPQVFFFLTFQLKEIRVSLYAVRKTSGVPLPKGKALALPHHLKLVISYPQLLIVSL